MKLDCVMQQGKISKRNKEIRWDGDGNEELKTIPGEPKHYGGEREAKEESFPS